MTRMFILVAAVTLAPIQRANAQSLRQICEADYRRVCSTVTPGNGRGRACLAQNRARLSPRCQAAIDQEIRRGRAPTPAPKVKG
jgi:hypothetical protein